MSYVNTYKDKKILLKYNLCLRQKLITFEKYRPTISDQEVVFKDCKTNFLNIILHKLKRPNFNKVLHHRWIKSQQVADRAIDIWPNVVFMIKH